MWGGPAVGVLAVRAGTRWRSPFPDDDREAGRVPGVPNVPAIVAAAASLRATLMTQDAIRTRHHRLIEHIRRTKDPFFSYDPTDRQGRPRRDKEDAQTR